MKAAVLAVLLLSTLAGSTYARSHKSKRNVFEALANLNKALHDNLKSVISNVPTVDDVLGIDSDDEDREVEQIDIRTGNQRPDDGDDEGEFDSEDEDEVESTVPNFNLFFPSITKAWYTGPNVCTDTEIIEEGDAEESRSGGVSMVYAASGSFVSSVGGNAQMYSKSCTQTDDEYKCEIQELKDGKKETKIEKRRCCYGYKRQAPDFYCKETDLKSMTQTLMDVKCGGFYNMSTAAGLEGILQSKNITIFCPSDEALEDLEEETNLIDANEIPLARRRRQAENELSYSLQNHMVEGFVRSTDFVDEGLLITLNKDSKIRTNVYRVPQIILTANCARVTSTNNFATNGVVHKIDRVIKPVKQTVADVITRNNDFTILKRLISAANLLPLLRDASSHLTVFAPTDQAFIRSGINLDRLESHGCLADLIKNHILPNVICSTAINRRVRSMNLLGKALKLKRDSNDQKLYIDDTIQITARDIMGTNGVVHIVDGVSVPTESMSLMAALEEATYDSLVDAINKTGLQNQLENGVNSTFLVPHQQALEGLPAEILEDNNKMKDLLLFHSIKSDKRLRSMRNNEIIKAKNGKTIRFNKYNAGFSGLTTAQCVPMPSRSLDMCGGTLQSLTGIMMPAEGKLMDILNREEKYSLAKDIIEAANMTETLNQDGPYTILLPPNEVLQRKLNEQQLSSYTEDSDQAKKFIGKYILPEMLCCSGIRDDPFGFFHNSVRTIGGDRLPVTRSSASDVPKLGRAKLVGCDNMAENGVIHEIDRLISDRGTPFMCIFGCN